MEKIERTQIDRIVRWEPAFFAGLIFLKIYRLSGQWGRLQGFDSWAYLEVFRATDWFQPLPELRAMYASYHPPLSYLMSKLIYDVYPKEVESTQILSTLSFIGIAILLRQAMKHCGVLRTLHGIAFLYVAASLPIFVHLGTATTYDSPTFFWSVLSLFLSVKLFWDPRKKHARWQTFLFSAALALAIAAGLCTKFTGLLNVVFPFLVIAIRERREGWNVRLRNLLIAGTVGVAGLAIAFPLYYQRYYKAEGQFFPVSMEWQRASDLAAQRRIRDEDPLDFFMHLFRPPPERFVGVDDPVVDSFFHVIWLHIWNRDNYLGAQQPISAKISNIYLVLFFYAFVIGTVLFFAMLRRQAKEWNDLGWMLLGTSALFTAGLVAFAYKYPLYDWGVIKAKYMAPGLLWIPFSIATAIFHRDLLRCGHAYSPRVDRAIILMIGTFVVLNHVIPVF